VITGVERFTVRSTHIFQMCSLQFYMSHWP